MLRAEGGMPPSQGEAHPPVYRSSPTTTPARQPPPPPHHHASPTASAPLPLHHANPNALQDLQQHQQHHSPPHPHHRHHRHPPSDLPPSSDLPPLGTALYARDLSRYYDPTSDHGDSHVRLAHDPARHDASDPTQVRRPSLALLLMPPSHALCPARDAC